MESNAYKKFYYWINSEDIKDVLEEAKEYLNRSDIPVAVSRQCEGLSMSKPIICVPPSVWSENCYRQSSWYRRSDLNDKYLIVSNEKLSTNRYLFKGKIEKIRIKNLPNPSYKEYIQLLDSREFKENAPEEWFILLDREKPIFKTYLERNNIPFTLEELLTVHSINHANFLASDAKITFNYRQNHEEIRCSLFSQELICSACMEIFGVIGRNLKKMIVKNCPGLKFVQLNKDEYLLVDILFL
jgi:hypothetical protein